MEGLEKEAILYYAEHPYEFCIDFLDLKPVSIEKEEWLKLSDEEKLKKNGEIIRDKEITWQQRDFLNVIPKALRDNKKVAVKAGHGVGKTTCESWLIIWFIFTRPHVKIPCTAPTREGLFDVLWSELSKWHSRFKFKDSLEWTKTHFYNKKYPETWFASARTSNKPENMQGFHADHLLFIVDEASGVAQEILEAVEGSQTQTGSLIIYLGNPTQISGGLFDAFNSKRNFYYTFTFNSEESPLVKPNYYRELGAKYGKDSDVYRVRVLGDFPKAEPDTLISLSRVEKAVNNDIEPPIIGEYNIVEIGVDVARFGDDETSIYSRHNNFIREEGFLRKRDLMYVVGEVVRVIRKYNNKMVLVNIDDSGLGGGVTDRLRELVKQGVIKAQIFPVNNGTKAKDEDNYVNCVTEMWDFMKDYIVDARLPNDNDLIAQLSTRKYTIDSKGRMMIEPKKELKKRHLRSPDRADGSILTLRSLIYGTRMNRSRAYAC